MSLLASRGAALLAPLPEPLPLTTIDESSLAMLASVETKAAGAAGMPASSGASGATKVTQPVSNAGVKSVAAPAPATEAPAKGAGSTSDTSAKSAFAAKTAIVAHVGKSAAMPQAPATAGSIGSAVLALVMVIGLILALGWLAKRMPGFRGASATSALRVVGSLALSPRERLVVVAVGDTQLVLGVGAGGTRTLHTLSEPLPVAEHAATPAFAQLLSQHFGKKA